MSTGQQYVLQPIELVSKGPDSYSVLNQILGTLIKIAIKNTNIFLKKYIKNNYKESANNNELNGKF